jgi:diadenosine tetraphosphate (Ap4A) HIT family hydrolase
MVHELKTVNLPTLIAGWTYDITANEYYNNRIHIKASGTAEKPITITASSNTLITANTTIKITGDYINFEGFTFRDLKKNKAIRIEGNHVKFSRNVFEGLYTDVEKLIQVTGHHCTITENTFRTMRFIGTLISVEPNKTKKIKCLIHKNNFSDRFTKNKRQSPQSIITIGNSKTAFDSSSIIYDNLFSNCSSETEMISVRSSNNIISHNKITNCEGQILLKNGNNNQVLSNYINGYKKDGAGGISINGENQIIKNNIFENLIDEDPLSAPISIMCGKETPINNITITDNQFLLCNSCFAIGVKHGKFNILPKNITANNNQIIKCLYIFNKDSDCKGSDETTTNISENPMFKKDQKLRFPVSVNWDNNNFDKLYTLLMTKDTEYDDEEKYPEEEKKEVVDILEKPYTEYKKEFIDELVNIKTNYEKIKLYHKQINELKQKMSKDAKLIVKLNTEISNLINLIDN